MDIQFINFQTKHVQRSILLVVPYTEYNSNVPLLLGTHVLGDFYIGVKQT